MNKPVSPARGLPEPARADALRKKRKGPGTDDALAQDTLLAAEGVDVAETGTAATAEALGSGAGTSASGTATSATSGTVITGVDTVGVAGTAAPSWLVTLGIWAGIGGGIALASGGGAATGGGNVAPTAADASVSGAENDGSISGQAPGQDSAGATLTYSVVGVAPAGLAFNADGSFSYVPQAADDALAGGESRVVAFDYVVSDGLLSSSPATITINVAGANDAPVAAALALAGSEDDAAIAGSVQAADAEGDSVTYSLSGSAPATLTFNPDGSFSYVPAPGDGVAGPGGTRVVSFQYVASDGTASSAPATVTLTLNGPNDAPTATPASAGGSENDAGIAGSVSASDPDGHGLTYRLVNAAPAGLTFNTDGTFTYVPQAVDQALDALESRVFTFDYVADDGLVDSAPATVTLTITGSNDNPVSGGAGAAAGTEDGGSFGGSVPAATDIDDEPVSYGLVGTPPAGVGFTGSTGAFTYTPQAADQALDDGETRLVTFLYRANDGTGISATHTVTITVSGANDAPTATNSARTVSENAVNLSSAVSGTDIDVETLTFSLVEADHDDHDHSPAPVGLTFNPDGTYTYALQAADQALDDGETRLVTFVFVASDGDLTSNEATVSITVNGANDAPVSGGALALSGSEDDGSIDGNVSATDVDGETLTYSVSGATPAGLTFNSDGTFIYVMQATDEALDTGESHDITFDYVATDGTASSAVATVTLTIQGADETSFG